MQQGRVIAKDVKSKPTNFRKEGARKSMVLEMISRPLEKFLKHQKDTSRKSLMDKTDTLERALGKAVSSVESLFQLRKRIDEDVGT